MTERVYLAFEKHVEDLDKQIASLSSKDCYEEITSLRAKREKKLSDLHKKLTPFQRVQLARHPNRPKVLDYFRFLLSSVVQLAGDRAFGDDKAMLAAVGKVDTVPVVVLGTEKGRDPDSRVRHNFGMAKPEGYRKAVRVMKLAEKFRLPVVTFVDTQGAYAGVDAEKRGQGKAIADSIASCLSLEVPIISFIIGEGGSGGAVALASSNRVIMLENSVYSVISPEACSSILWKSVDHAEEAAKSLKLTATDMKNFGVADHVIKEPVGGAHEDPNEIFLSVKGILLRTLAEYNGKAPEDIIREREERFISLGKNL